MAEEPQEVIEGEVISVLLLEKSIEDLEAELAKDEQFQSFLSKQKEAKEQIANAWKRIETDMIENNVKSIKGDWGSITVAERTNFKIDESQLPTKFFKKVPDTVKIAGTYRLEGKPPKGANPYTIKYLTKRIK